MASRKFTFALPSQTYTRTNHSKDQSYTFPKVELNSTIIKPLIISLGIDCGPQIIIKKANILQETFPFDWCITYKGVSNIIQNGYTNLLSNPISSNDDESYIDNVNGIKFKHDGKLIEGKYIQDTNKEKTLDEVRQKYTRRLERLHDYLKAYNTSKNNQQVIFVRKSHDDQHHSDAVNYGIEIKNDIDDSIELNNFLSETYPQLNYLIIVFLICEKCFSKDISFENAKIIGYGNIKLHCIKKDDIKLYMTDIKKAHLRTNPTQFNTELYCYTDKLKENIAITIKMCGGFNKKSRKLPKQKSRKLPKQKSRKFTRTLTKKIHKKIIKKN
jgi:hypothetical protein